MEKIGSDASERLSQLLERSSAVPADAGEPRIMRLLDAQETDMVTGAEWVHSMICNPQGYTQSRWVWVESEYTQNGGEEN